MSFEVWLAFFLVALVPTSTPGPAMLLVASHSVSMGVGKAVFTILGNVTGLAILSGLSVLGLSSLLIHSPLAFTLVKLFGAVYLIYLGVSLWRKGLSPVKVAPNAVPKGGVVLYLQGVALALSNPKAILFTTALFPQFIDLSMALLPQFLILVVTFITLSFVFLLLCAILVRRTATTMANSAWYTVLGKLFGGVFLGAGSVMLLSVYRSN